MDGRTDGPSTTHTTKCRRRAQAGPSAADETSIPDPGRDGLLVRTFPHLVKIAGKLFSCYLLPATCYSIILLCRTQRDSVSAQRYIFPFCLCTLDMEKAAKSLGSSSTDYIYHLANVPSMALFRVQEHVTKNVPQLCQRSEEVDARQKEIRGSMIDADFSIDAVRDIASSRSTIAQCKSKLLACLARQQDPGRPSPSS